MCVVCVCCNVIGYFFVEVVLLFKFLVCIVFFVIGVVLILDVVFLLWVE